MKQKSPHILKTCIFILLMLCPSLMTGALPPFTGATFKGVTQLDMSEPNMGSKEQEEPH